jgi:hypothetical protein
VYSMLVTAAVFHLDTSPLNDDAPLNMDLQAGRQVCNAAVPHRGGREDRTELGVCVDGATEEGVMLRGTDKGVRTKAERQVGTKQRRHRAP